MTEKTGHRDLKTRLGHELKEYWMITIYLIIWFGSFTTYRKLVLEEFNLGAIDYGMMLVKSMVLGKVVLIGRAMHLGKRFESRPLAVPVLAKTVIFTAFAALFSACEELVKALIHHHPLAETFDLSGARGYEVLSRLELLMVVFVPFFAISELSRVLGAEKLYALFFHHHPAEGAESSTKA